MYIYVPDSLYCALKLNETFEINYTSKNFNKYIDLANDNSIGYIAIKSETVKSLDIILCSCYQVTLQCHICFLTQDRRQIIQAGSLLLIQKNAAVRTELLC